MQNSNAFQVVTRFWIVAFLCSLPFGLPAVATGAISLAFLAFVALLVALFYNAAQWLGHRLLFCGTPEYEEFRRQGKDAWFDHSAPWPFRPDEDLLTSPEDEPTWRCEYCHAPVTDQPCSKCGVEWLCPRGESPVASEFAACQSCGHNSPGK